MDDNGAAPFASRRDENTSATRDAIVAAAQVAFAEKGFAATSLEDIVGPVRLTKGALYHHFASKAAVLEAVYTKMERELVTSVHRAAESATGGPWETIVASLDAFFEASAEPAYVSIVLRDAPFVLGTREARAIDHALGLELVESLVRALYPCDVAPPLPLGAAARVLLAAASEVAMSMAYADDPGAARAEGRAVVLALLAGLRDAR
jgi:AcrR family transcriptional regulator